MNFFKKIFGKTSELRSGNEGRPLAESNNKASEPQSGDESAPLAEPNLQRYINDLNDPEKRSAAVTEFREIDHSAAARAIVEVLLGKQESNLSYVLFVTNAIRVLGEIGDPFAVPLLLDILKGRLDTLRSVAADALGKIGHQAAVPDLLKALMNDEHWTVRASAASALGKIGDPTAMPALFEAARKGNQFVRFNATEALNKLQSATPK